MDSSSNSLQSDAVLIAVRNIAIMMQATGIFYRQDSDLYIFVALH